MRNPLVADVVDRKGNAIALAAVEIRLREDQTPVLAFSAEIGADVVDPLLTNASGQAVAWLDPGEYEWRGQINQVAYSDWTPFDVAVVDAVVSPIRIAQGPTPPIDLPTPGLWIELDSDNEVKTMWVQA